MAEEQAGEKTDEATPKRAEDARKKGQIPRSKELTTASLLIFAGLGLKWTGPGMVETLLDVSKKSFGFRVIQSNDDWWLVSVLMDSVAEIFIATIPLFAMLFVAAAVSPIILGGWNFSAESLAFKGDRLSPLNGFKRMFGISALIELIKGVGKFSIVGVVAFSILNKMFDELLSLETESLEMAIQHGLSLVLLAFLGVSASLLMIVAIDVPYQIWNHNKELKMTKQEIKDEYKDSEGRPEIKSKIRQQQRAMAQRRMMSEIPTADVIITNPDHYSVALKYEDFGTRAPVVVAKGVDIIAFKIREIARAHNITIVQAPPLARSIYYTTKLNHEIPNGLFLAVAQVLAYVYQLNTYEKTGGRRPQLNDNIPIPDDLSY
ncbi:MAG: flagellar biosynthesis protein FlhB [Gammaproteobacteria bacterium CG22_combo_CG10-13_8_21_14_all_40_8]|nr:MAG: flagellar biosynthesis protein FlhB [Gammaproteobacteria bacterium CG22_combo_CG10-13_8_21_14_all_40_8]